MPASVNPTTPWRPAWAVVVALVVLVACIPLGFAFIRLILLSNGDPVGLFVGGLGTLATLPPAFAMIRYLARGGRTAFAVGAIWGGLTIGINLLAMLPH